MTTAEYDEERVEVGVRPGEQRRAADKERVSSRAGGPTARLRESPGARLRLERGCAPQSAQRSSEGRASPGYLDGFCSTSQSEHVIATKPGKICGYGKCANLISKMHL